MKRITTLMVLMLTAIVGSVAQDMKVVDFKLLENDLTANRYETQKLDQNGERTALIKIVTPERGFAFDGGSLGIVATEEHTGEIWLYVPLRPRSSSSSIRTTACCATTSTPYPLRVAGHTRC